MVFWWVFSGALASAQRGLAGDNQRVYTLVVIVTRAVGVSNGLPAGCLALLGPNGAV